jgi:hypothetical protein
MSNPAEMTTEVVARTDLVAHICVQTEQNSVLSRTPSCSIGGFCRETSGINGVRGSESATRTVQKDEKAEIWDKLPAVARTMVTRRIFIQSERYVAVLVGNTS